MTMAELSQQLKVTSDGILELITKYGLLGELENGSETSFVPNLNKLMRKEWSWVRSKEDQANMLMEVFTRVFLTRGKAVFEGYIPIGQEGHKASLEGYLNFILGRAFVEVSKLEYTKRTSEQKFEPQEGQSMDDAVDFMQQGEKKTKTSLDLQNRFEDVTDLLNRYHARYDELMAQEDTPEYRLKFIEDKIEKLESELAKINQQLEFQPKQYGEPKEIIEHPLTQDESLHLDQMKDDLLNLMKKRGNYQAQVTVLYYLLEDFSPSEIARAMEVSPAKISQRIAILKEDANVLAQKYIDQGDNTLSKFIDEFMAKGARANKAKVENIPSHYTESISIFATVTREQLKRKVI